MLHKESDLLTTQDVARAADGEVCTATVRQWANTGKLPATRTASGVRLFRRADVERFLADRRQTRAAKER